MNSLIHHVFWQTCYLKPDYLFLNRDVNAAAELSEDRCFRKGTNYEKVQIKWKRKYILDNLPSDEGMN